MARGPDFLFKRRPRFFHGGWTTLKTLLVTREKIMVDSLIPNFKLNIFFLRFQGLNFRLAFAIAAGAFGSAFQHGYNTGVLNSPQKLIMGWVKDCDENTTQIQPADAVTDGQAEECMSDAIVTLIWSWIVSAFCVGGVIGGSAVGVVASRIGRFVIIDMIVIEIRPRWTFSSVHFDQSFSECRSMPALILPERECSQNLWARVKISAHF